MKQQNESDFDIDQLINTKKIKFSKRHKGVSMKEMELKYETNLLKQNQESVGAMQEGDMNSHIKTIGLISAGGKAPQFQYSTLGKFEIKDKKLEEYLNQNNLNKGKSDFELENEKKQLELEQARKRILDEKKDLYKIPAHLDVDKLKQDRRLIDQKTWINGLMEVPISQEKKIQNVEEAERMRLQSLKKVFDDEDLVNQPHRIERGRDGRPKKNDLQKLVEFEKHALKKNRDRDREQQKRLEYNRQLDS
eukprot:403339735